jgi:hypothetical protein
MHVAWSDQIRVCIFPDELRISADSNRAGSRHNLSVHATAPPLYYLCTKADHTAQALAVVVGAQSLIGAAAAPPDRDPHETQDFRCPCTPLGDACWVSWVRLPVHWYSGPFTSYVGKKGVVQVA